MPSTGYWQHSHRAGGMHHPAGGLFGGIDKTPVDPDILRVLSYHSLIWWDRRGRVHGPLSRRPREAALRSFWAARKQWKLDHRRKYSRDGGWTLRKILWTAISRR